MISFAPVFQVVFFEDTKLNEARDFWEKGLGRLMKEVPVFDTIIADLRKELEFLQMSRHKNLRLSV